MTIEWYIFCHCMTWKAETGTSREHEPTPTLIWKYLCCTHAHVSQGQTISSKNKWEENFCKYWIYVGIVAAAADCRVVSSWGVSNWGSLYSWGGNRESINRSNLKRPLCLKFLTQGSCTEEGYKSFGLVQDLLGALQTCFLFKVFAESVYTRKYLG